MNARRPGLYEKPRKTAPGFSLWIVTDDGLTARFALERGRVTVQLGDGPKASVFALHDALGLDARALIAELCARQALRGQGRRFALAERIAPGEWVRASAPTAAQVEIELESLAGRVAATDIVDADSGMVLAEPGVRLQPGYSTTSAWSAAHDAPLPPVSSPFELVAIEHEARAEIVRGTWQSGDREWSAAIAPLDATRSEALSRGELTLGPRCRVALDAAFAQSITEETLTRYDLLALWRRLLDVR